MHGKKTYWGRAKQEPKPKFGQVFPVERPPPPRRSFIPSYETDPCNPPMGWLLGWEYGRIWLCERDAYLKTTQVKAKRTFVKPDFSSWLLKHAAKPEPTSLFEKRKELREKQKRLLAEKAAVEKELQQKKNKKKAAMKNQGMSKSKLIKEKVGSRLGSDTMGMLNPQLQQAIIDKPSNLSATSSKSNYAGEKRPKGGCDVYYKNNNSNNDSQIIHDKNKTSSSSSPAAEHYNNGSRRDICYCGCCRHDNPSKFY